MELELGSLFISPPRMARLCRGSDQTCNVSVLKRFRSAIWGCGAKKARAEAGHAEGRILKDHVSDDAREMLAKKVVEHLELSGFEIHEDEEVMKRRPPRHGHG
jgi:hypothetical protein